MKGRKVRKAELIIEFKVKIVGHYYGDFEPVLY
jgi:hypothetical protein